jgi:hypothetical protein
MSTKVSFAAITSTIMAISMQVHAGEKLNVEQAESGGVWADQVNLALRNKEPRDAVKMAMLGLAQNVVVNGHQSPIDVSVILQNREQDSTNGFGATGDPGLGRAATCYSNCHSACHGSRNWR